MVTISQGTQVSTLFRHWGHTNHLYLCVCCGFVRFSEPPGPHTLLMLLQFHSNIQFLIGGEQSNQMSNWESLLRFGQGQVMAEECITAESLLTYSGAGMGPHVSRCHSLYRFWRPHAFWVHVTKDKTLIQRFTWKSKTGQRPSVYRLWHNAYMHCS